MKKLSLNLDDIRVTGFATLPPEAKEAGTVMGADALTIRTQCNQDTCYSCRISDCPGDC